MEYLIYISSAKRIMSESELADILSISRMNNTAANITGMLIYADGTFIQVIEGESKDLKALFKKIELDPRHKSIITLAEGSLSERNFPDWSMAFITPNLTKMEQLQGFINPNKPGFLKSDKSHAAITVLKTFAENNRVITK